MKIKVSFKGEMLYFEPHHGLNIIRDLNVFATPNMDSREQRKRAVTASDYQPFERTGEFSVSSYVFASNVPYGATARS